MKRSFPLILAALFVVSGCVSQKKAEAPQAAKSVAAPAPQTNATKTESKTKPAKAPAGVWEDLFDGETLAGWKEADFSGNGPVKVEGGKIILRSGVMTGITWTNPVIKMDYELELKAMRVDGSDFFCGLTFPVGEDPCSLIVGGWGGGVVGLSSLDGEDAANNETTKYMNFENGRWYTIRLRVQPTRIQAWIDDEQIINVDIKDRKISIRIEVEASRPLGIATWSTTGALKDLRIRKL